MNIIDLNGAWELQDADGRYRVPAVVPGVVHLDLLRAEIIQDPYYRKNEEAYRWIGLSDWIYERRFHVPRALLKEKAVRLICEGLDTISEISINGTPLGRTDNMFRRFTFDVCGTLREGDNHIRIAFTSPAAAARERAKHAPYPIPCTRFDHDEPHRNFIRKSGAHFGWDWGPCFLPTGIWRPIRIEAFSHPRITAVTTLQHHMDNRDVRLEVRVFVDCPADCRATLSLQLHNQAPHKQTVTLARGSRRVLGLLDVPKPDRWWPAGYGRPTLYPLDIRIQSEGGEDRTSLRIGFRTIACVRESDDAGESFFFKVNGTPIYIKGSNWIPADCFDNRISGARLQHLLQSAKDANMNLIRAWGGGIYEQDSFFDICDALGLLVWQDFMFACSMYPADEAFLENVRQEVRHQVRRLSNHPCILLWCGNNENEQALGWYDETRADRDRYLEDYSRLYLETIPQTLREEDPYRPYWPSSPSNGPQAWGNPQDPSRGDVHYWGVWHGGEPFTAYLDIRPRFSSEFGFQSFPSGESLRTVTSRQDRHITSDVMTFRQRSPNRGNASIIEHTSRHFRTPEGFENFIYVSQILQAVSIKTACEHWRRIKPHCMGSIIWQLNDIWQGPSWSSLEYDGRWKILHYFAVHFFAPVLVSSVEQADQLAIWLTSDLPHPIQGTLAIDLYSWEGEKIQCAQTAFTVPPFSSQAIWHAPVLRLVENSDMRAGRFLSYRAVWRDGAAHNHHFFCPLKQVTLEKPVITLRAGEADAEGRIDVSIHSNRMAPYAFLSAGSIQGRFSDNAFLLYPGETRTITFHGRGHVHPEALRANLTIKTLRDSYS